MSSREDDADKAEEAAHRVAMEAYLNALTKALKGRDVVELASTEHEHEAMLLLDDGAQTARACMFVRLRVIFGDVVPEDRVKEMVAVARANPGGVPRA